MVLKKKIKYIVSKCMCYSRTYRTQLQNMRKPKRFVSRNIFRTNKLSESNVQNI